MQTENNKGISVSVDISVDNLGRFNELVKDVAFYGDKLKSAIDELNNLNLNFKIN